MVKQFYQTHIFTQQKRLKTHLREKYDLSWTEYLVLCSIHQIEETFGFATATEIIDELQLNRDWVYQTIRNLELKSFLEITKTGNPWVANRLTMIMRAKILLHAVERFVERKVST